MSRWHQASCDTPSVSVQAGIPYCEACGESPDIDKLIKEQASVNPPWTIPPDEKPGELRLRWPASVIHNFTTDVSTETPITTTNGQSDVSKSIHGSDSLSHPIYKKRLSGNEFRILTISPALDEGYPIHAVLGDYQIDCYPDYETVSYCWGGEDGDASKSRPIYIGNYWDILLQTKNCWSLLKYIRLESHVRLIWVDAICINQDDNLEKETQVPLMGQIYRRCLRTIIYLGEDVAKPKDLFPLKGRSYPKRRDFTAFDDLIPKSIMSRAQLFQLRYFQRVWVIQEVILSPLAVIPAHGYEFTVRAGTNLTRRQTRRDNPSHPWMDFACTGSLSKSLLSLIQQTRSSLATDPRDKVYGILGLGPQATGLRPDYSISRLHTYIGTVIHLLSAEKCTDILIGAGSHQSASKTPSWLPDWSLEDIGERLLSISQASRTFSESEGMCLGAKIAWLDKNCFTLFNSNDYTHPAELIFTTSSLWNGNKPYVDPKSLKLTLPLIHVCKFSSGLAEVSRIKYVGDRHCEPYRVFSLDVAGCKLYVCTPDATVQNSVEAGDNELFILHNAQGENLVLFMKRLSENGDHRLLWCTSCYDIFLSRDPSSSPPFEKLSQDVKHFNRFRNIGPSILDASVMAMNFRTVEGCRKKDKKTQESIGMVNSLDQNNIDRCILNLYKQMVYNSEATFVDSYVDFLLAFSHGCVAWNEQGMAYVEISPYDLQQSCGALCFNASELELEVYVTSKNETEGAGTWVVAKLQDESIQKALEYRDWHIGSLKKRRMRVSASNLRRCLKWSTYDQTPLVLWNCNRILHNAESVLRSAGPWNTPVSICYYPWPESFFEEGQIPGRICQVTII